MASAWREFELNLACACRRRFESIQLELRPSWPLSRQFAGRDHDGPAQHPSREKPNGKRVDLEHQPRGASPFRHRRRASSGQPQFGATTWRTSPGAWGAPPGHRAEIERYRETVSRLSDLATTPTSLVSPMPSCVMSTSGRIHGEFLRPLFIIAGPSAGSRSCGLTIFDAFKFCRGQTSAHSRLTWSWCGPCGCSAGAGGRLVRSRRRRPSFDSSF